MDNFTPVSALIGGVLIGLSATMMLLLRGRIAGISGILGGLLSWPEDALERLAFVGGLLGGGLLLECISRQLIDSVHNFRSTCC